MRYFFPKSSRLLKRRHFLRRTSQRKRYFGDSVVVHTQKNQFEDPRLGITVTKKYGNAVQRNRFKRIVREAFRLIKHKIHGGVDIIIKPAGGAARAGMPDIKKELEGFFIN